MYLSYNLSNEVINQFLTFNKMKLGLTISDNLHIGMSLLMMMMM
jgi:hypothetical protein